MKRLKEGRRESKSQCRQEVVVVKGKGEEEVDMKKGN